jgi:hypothetical protein
MIKKIKSYFQSKQKQQKDKEQLEQAQKYYKILREGALFIRFIQDDLKKMKDEKFNRHERRRFEKMLSVQGEINEEMGRHYYNKIEQILDYIDKQLNSKTKKTETKNVR